ncbi:hypothetical protein VSDG_04082 [Cytospora chrysosperma]|uniref:Trichothecene 3-O-acetyltransferase-like N-terminal domain-containing protein n=1 Tax=Cytospora chrysosperma TaxID=252740 RepID=A0A423W103_CYTCH|nr:hypothetical protein VSDG_04082 [Valsa sordida]
MNATSLSGLLDNFPLDILGQQDRINRLYTQITLCFPVPEVSSDLQTRIDGIIRTLSQGLVQLSTALPWIAGSVVREYDDFKIKPSVPPNNYSRIRINYLDIIPGFPSWEDLSHRLFPFSVLDEDIIAPCKAMVPGGEELPVLLVLANFIQGGLLLTINAQHGCMDMRGQGQVLYLLAKACRGETFTAEEAEVGNMQRVNHIPLLGEDLADCKATAGEDSRRDKAEPTHVSSGSSSASPISQPLPVWTYLAFPSSSLSSLKSLATKTLPADTFVSTDDVLTAFIWKAISRTRQTRLQQQQGYVSPSTTLTRNVDVRRYFGLPSTYPGLVTTATSHTCTLDELVSSQDLGSIASSLRAALNQDSLVLNTRAQATAISRDRNEAGKQSIAATSNPGLDVRVSSWAKEDFYSLDFGPLLGKPECVRRPRFADGAREGLVYFLPKDRDGDIVVGVCLRGEDLERLKEDGEIKLWSRWIG